MTELVVIRASDEKGLIGEMTRLIGFLDRVSGVSLTDVAYTCSLGKGESVIAIIAEDVTSLRARLFSARSRLENVNVKRLRDKSGTYYFRDHLLGEGKGKLAFLFPGVMSFYPDMMRDMAIAYPQCRSAFDELEDALAGESGGFVPSSFVFPPAPYYRHDADIFSSGAYAQALVSTYSACAALERLLRSGGVEPDGVVGFAGGDLAAVICSGAAGARPSRPDRVRVIKEIYALVNKAVDHAGLPEVAMISVLLRREGEIDELIGSFPPDKVSIAVDFSPRQKTYAVAADFEQEAMQAFSVAGVRAVKLALNRPFNTRMCEKFVPFIRKFSVGWIRCEPTCDVYSCASAGRISGGLKAARDDTAGRWARPVRFGDTVRRMHDDGYRVFLEVGPRGLMTSAVSDALRDKEHAAIALNSIHRRGILQMQHAVAQLVALGAKMDLTGDFVRRKARKLDFDSVISLEVRKDAEMKLSRSFPRLTLLSLDPELQRGAFMTEPGGRGAKVASRAAAQQRARRQRQFDFGAMNPLVSDADMLESSPGVSVELTKVFRLADFPFIGDFALGTSQLSYSDPNLKGLIPLSLSLGVEIMAEAAQIVVPNRVLTTVENLQCRRLVSFDNGSVKLFVRAERVASGDPERAAVKVQLRDDTPNAAYTWPVMEAVFMLADEPLAPIPVAVEPLAKPRSVHWSGRDIYPSRLCCGRRLRTVQFVEAWCESGLDYEIAVPSLSGSVSFTSFPMWVVNPLLMEAMVSGFPLWRSHERFAGAVSFPFRMRRMDLRGIAPKEDSRLKCYMRLTGVTPKSHICDITVTDGNGKQLYCISGWEELTERVPGEYRELVMQPAMTFLTQIVPSAIVGAPATDVASAFITDVPYPIFERNEELWLKVLSRVILSASERRDFSEMKGSTSRRVEWLFGRVAAKEAVRRFLKDFYQARWSDADVQIWADDSGKPHALGAWSDFLTTKLDIAIAHTAQFVVAVAAANARVGVDVESSNRDLSEEFTAGVFTHDELELAAQAANPSQTIIRFWCAKEAVSKALGTGIRYSPREMVVADYLPDSGVLTMRLEGAWAEAFKRLKGRSITVSVGAMREHALAFCFIPASLFETA